MQKITLKAFELAGYDNPEVLAKIVSYVPNPQVATEMLLGVHQPIKIADLGKYRQSSKRSRDTFIEIVEIDELADVVKYKRYEQKTVCVYYATQQDKADGKFTYTAPPKYSNYDWVPATGFTCQDTQDTVGSFLDTWNTPFTPTDATTRVSEWESYQPPAEPTVS